MNDIKYILKDLRKSRNLTQFQLSQLLNIGQATIAGYENGTREPHINSLIAYANFFECTIDYLVGREDELGNVVIQSDTPATLPPDEQELLNIYQSLSPAHRSQVLEYARYFAEKSGSTRRKA